MTFAFQTQDVLHHRHGRDIGPSPRGLDLSPPAAPVSDPARLELGGRDPLQERPLDHDDAEADAVDDHDPQGDPVRPHPGSGQGRGRPGEARPAEAEAEERVPDCRERIGGTADDDLDLEFGGRDLGGVTRVKRRGRDIKRSA